MPATVRPLEPADVEPAVVVFRDALVDLQVRLGHPVSPWSEERLASVARRIDLLRANDPGGSFVADLDGEVVGLAQAAQREDLWTLCHFFVSPTTQSRGTGAALLAPTLATADPAGRGAIVSTPDERAMRHYVRAGFDLHPTVIGYGEPKLDAVRSWPTPLVREGSAADLGLTADVDRAVRGAAREVDLALWLDAGVRLLVVDDRGYALLRGAWVSALVALDEEAATQLLVAGVALAAESATTVEVSRMLAGQQWAIRTVSALGLPLHAHGPIMLRNQPPPARPFLPDASLF